MVKKDKNKAECSKYAIRKFVKNEIFIYYIIKFSFIKVKIKGINVKPKHIFVVKIIRFFISL